MANVKKPYAVIDFHGFEKQLVMDCEYQKKIYLYKHVQLEYYTGYLRLARIDKTIELLKKLSDLQEIQRSTADESLSNIYQSIRSDLANFVAPPSSGTEISRGFIKAAAGALS